MQPWKSAVRVTAFRSGSALAQVVGNSEAGGAQSIASPLTLTLSLGGERGFGGEARFGKVAYYPFLGVLTLNFARC